MSGQRKERPILFSGPMVRALLDGRKTQTRRVLKFSRQIEAIEGGVTLTTFDRMQDGYPDGPRPVFDFDGEPNSFSVRNPYGAVGDRLWVRETWASLTFHHDWETGYVDDLEPAAVDREGVVVYDADPHGFNEGGDSVKDRGFAWRPSIFMPRWASRLTLEIIEVRVERVQSITTADAWAEGIRPEDVAEHAGDGTADLCDPETAVLDDFRMLWDELNAPRGYCWIANPWVWCLSFRVVPA